MALTRDRIIETAAQLADAQGIEAVTMRRLADELGVEAMSLYHHTPNKAAILDGLVDLVFSEVISEVTPSQPLRSRILTARTVMLRHPWAPALVETRTQPGLPMLQYVDGVIASLRADGLSFDLIHHAMHALGSRAFGFVQEMSDSGASADQIGQLATVAPSLAAMLAEVVHDDPESTLGWCDDQTEFEFGLDLLLDGLTRRSG
jgi:AcrR family transcriptional regulator